MTATAAAATPSAQPSAGAAVQVPVLPRPTGHDAVGRITAEMTDAHRTDPWVPSAGPRKLMVSLFYPARRGTGSGPAPYMTTAEARDFLADKAPSAVPFAPEMAATREWARADAVPSGGRHPLVLLSPGFTFPRATLTSLSEDLASHGYVVALVGATYEDTGTTFPDGTTLTCAICDQPPAGGVAAIARSRAKDISFVVDQLTHRPASGDAPLARVEKSIDAKRIGMAGHSIGGDATAAAMAHDQRIRAGVNLDGTFFYQVPKTGLGNRPFLMINHVMPGVTDKTWTKAWSRLTGYKRWFAVDGADHGSFTDIHVLADAAGITGAPGMTATISASRGIAITRAYVRAFFDHTLEGRPEPLLNGSSPAYPEVSPQP
ncbi:alpha/beta hydrolase [Mangrovactinospora gilvigrisea]|uniref:Alpha/beta hydrolase n=2 Tax=Mangrovactinospora gilvigrisea TaxID=1428644 RepID=A0A1J7BEQ8_9ACTN|nr:alpha/beta hydrolase [Mangrovactinospora gilvigrisea]